MNRNITMAIDEDLLKKAKKIAVDKNTTLTGLIRDYLAQIVEQEESNKQAIIEELERLFNESKMVVGKKKWTRDELHER